MNLESGAVCNREETIWSSVGEAKYVRGAFRFRNNDLKLERDRISYFCFVVTNVKNFIVKLSYFYSTYIQVRLFLCIFVTTTHVCIIKRKKNEMNILNYLAFIENIPVII